MRGRDQLIGSVALAVVTYFGILRIAEAKCDRAVGSRGVRLNEAQRDELAAFQRLQIELVRIGQGGFADRLEQLRQKDELWVAPGLGPDRWAAYVEALGLVRRIYIRRVALLDPRAHLYPQGATAVPVDFQTVFAWLSLGGAMRHELAHRDGALEEALAYQQELDWYVEIRRSAFLAARQGDERAAWDWAIESAILSARRAAKQAGALLASTHPDDVPPTAP